MLELLKLRLFRSQCAIAVSGPSNAYPLRAGVEWWLQGTLFCQGFEYNTYIKQLQTILSTSIDCTLKSRSPLSATADKLLLLSILLDSRSRQLRLQVNCLSYY